MSELKYLSGFGNEFATESVPGALPVGQNTPQHCPKGLYAEQLNGTAFTVARSGNQRSWLYRIKPSVVKSDYVACQENPFMIERLQVEPNQRRWGALPALTDQKHFIEGLIPWVKNGGHEQFTGACTYLYQCNQDMTDTYFYNADGDMMLVPQAGRLRVRTEFGVMEVAPSEIAVVQRGIKFAVDCLDGQASGYVCENYGLPFQLPDLGPIGANGLANSRDFLTPVAAFEDKDAPCQLLSKYSGELFTSTLNSSPLDVVAWHGNFAPYKYDLRLFNTINTVSYDHPDPSIFTVLTSPSGLPGTANLDFVIFGPRWMVAENTFRPPYYHRNIMSEFMGLVYGQYDAKETGFVPGGASLHNCMSPHGPDLEAYEKATTRDLKPVHYDNTLAFMFESRLPWHVTEYAAQASTLQANYTDCWQGLARHYQG